MKNQLYYFLTISLLMTGAQQSLAAQGAESPQKAAFAAVGIAGVGLGVLAAYAFTKLRTAQEAKQEPTIQVPQPEEKEVLVPEEKVLTPEEEADEEIDSKLHQSLKEFQKEFYLRKKIEMIRKELNEENKDIDEFSAKLEQLNAPEDVKKEIENIIKRLSLAHHEAEKGVFKSHLELIFSLPWGVETVDNLNLTHAKNILDAEQYGLNKIKELVLDFIATRTLKKDGHSPILCFVGPPGVGKTSLAKSIAKSLGRNFARISLGGVHGETELRGSRRVYLGAAPGQIIQSLKNTKSHNPVILLDELDKLGSSSHMGNSAAALLEILDPQQNKTFRDHYVNIPYDLSKVMFIATANSLESIPEALRDRLAIIQLSSYLLEEKVDIAQRHLIKNAINDAGLNDHNMQISNEVIQDIIKSYTQEAGVRQLDRIIKKLCSKAARSIVEEKGMITVDVNNIEDYLGPRILVNEQESTQNLIGIVNGLAWTSYGGTVLKIEAVRMPGTGKLKLTGNLGKTMQESAQAALSYARVNAKEFGIKKEMFTQYDLHIHCPAGGTPKDGPSAGLAMLTAVVSACTGRAVNGNYAMTGEINLRGDAMPIGGVREKLLAAQRKNMTHVLLPYANRSDLVEIKDLISNNMTVILVKNAKEVLKHILLP